MCARPMRARGLSFVPHQFVCATNPETRQWECGGHAPPNLGGFLWSDGTDSDETYNSDQCDATEQGPNDCEEKCVIWYIRQPRPTYSVALPGVRNCYDWAEDTVSVCKKRCADDPSAGDFLWRELH